MATYTPCGPAPVADPHAMLVGLVVAGVVVLAGVALILTGRRRYGVAGVLVGVLIGAAVVSSALGTRT